MIFLKLFLTFFEIGLFTFGGGYAMIHVLDHEFVEKKKWLEDEEYADLVTVAESTPGPIAINCATYIGYKTQGFLGATVATLGMCLPSFAVIFLISLFFNAFLEIAWVASAFRGIQIGVVFLILAAGCKMFKKMKKTLRNLLLFAATFAAMLLFGFLSIAFSSIYYILIGGGVGLLCYIWHALRAHRTSKPKEVDK
jgi:chromate transporter